MANVVMETARVAIELLERLGLAYVLCGGLALQPWGRLRTTLDVDLLVDADNGAVAHLQAELLAAGFRLRRPLPEQLDGILLLQATREHPRLRIDIPVDFLIARSEFHRHVVARGAPLPVGAHSPRVVSAEDLILLKLVANRPIDRADAQDLYAVNLDALDVAYLNSWSEKLGVRGELEEIRRTGA